jgi:hypothetical protein
VPWVPKTDINASCSNCLDGAPEFGFGKALSRVWRGFDAEFTKIAPARATA